jgi:hypothetical protein
MISVSSAFATFACHSGRTRKRKRGGTTSAPEHNHDNNPELTRSSALSSTLANHEHKYGSTFSSSRCVTKDHFQIWFEDYIVAPMPLGAAFRAASLVTDLMRFEDHDPTNSGWRVSPVLPKTNRQPTEAERLFAGWARHCTRVCSPLLRIAPLACFLISSYPLWWTSKPGNRRGAIAEWASLFGDEGMLQWVDMMADLVQSTVSNEVHEATALPLAICHLISPMYVCTCNANQRPGPCHCKADFDFLRS